MDGDRLLIVGFGNTLVADDGAGPAVIAALQADVLPAGVRAEDGGSDALCLSSLWRGESEVWIVDAVVSGAAPGAVLRLAHDEVLSVPQRHVTAHSLSLPECLRWIALAYPATATVRYRFWGIEIQQVDLCEALSPPVGAAVRLVAAEILEAAASRAEEHVEQSGSR